ncbi:hypothetical protein ACFL57_03070 [Candidatus Margulisiibacteriota bacterium]
MESFRAGIAKPRRPVKADRLKQQIYKHGGESQESFEWGAKNVNFMMEVMKFMPRGLRESFSGINPKNATEANYLYTDDGRVISSTGEYYAPGVDQVMNPHDEKRRYTITEENVDKSVTDKTQRADNAYYTDVHSYKSNFGADFPGINSGRAYKNVNFNPMITEFNHIKVQSLKDEEDDDIISMQNNSALEDIDIFSSTPDQYKTAGAYNDRNMTIHGQVFGARDNPKDDYSDTYSGGIGNRINSTVFNQAMAKVKDYVFDPARANATDYVSQTTADYWNNEDESCRFNNYWDIAINMRYDDFDSSETTKGEHAFGLMASMIESRRRYIGAMSEIFGDTVDIFDDQAMITHMENWINDERGGDLNEHTAGLYMMFFQGQIYLHRHFYPFFGDANDAGYRHAGVGSNFTGDRVMAFKKWMVAGAEEHAGYGAISTDAIIRDGTGALGIDVSTFAGVTSATQKQMTDKLKEIVGFIETIEAADLQAEKDRIVGLPLTEYKDDNVIKKTHRPNIQTEVKKVLWDCIERSGTQEQWSVKDLFAKDAGGTNMSTSVKNNLDSIVSKMNDTETTQINGVQSKSIDSYIDSLDVSDCKADIIDAISKTCTSYNSLAKKYYVKQDVDAFGERVDRPVWGNSLDVNSTDPVVKQKVAVKAALTDYVKYYNIYRNKYSATNRSNYYKYRSIYHNACESLAKEGIKAGLTRNNNKEWVQSTVSLDFPTINSGDSGSTTDCVEIMKRYLPGYCPTINLEEQNQINTIKDRTINGYYGTSYNNNSDIKQLWDGLDTGSIADNLIANCISRDGAANNDYGFTTWSPGTRFAANTADGLPDNNISSYLGNYTDRLNTIETGVVEDKEAEIRLRDLQFYLDKPADYPDIKTAWDWLEGRRIKLDNTSIGHNGTDWVLTVGNATGEIGTLLKEIVAEMNVLDGDGAPAGAWDNPRYKGDSYIKSRWEQIDTYHTVQTEYSDTTGVFPHGVVEGGLYNSSRLSYKINSETDHSLGWEVYSKSSSGYRTEANGGGFDRYDSRLSQAYHQTHGMTMSQIRGTHAANGDPYNNNWAVHAMGRLSRFVEKSIGRNVAARVGNRARAKKYREDKKEYDEKVNEEMYDEAMMAKKAAKSKAQLKAGQQKAEAKNKATRKKELKKAESKLIKSRKKQEAQAKKAAKKNKSGSKKKS